MFIKLNDIDEDRLESVRAGEFTSRGAGKSVLKLLTFLSYVNIHNQGKTFLFVTENYLEASNFYYGFFYWLTSKNIDVTNADALNYEYMVRNYIVQKPKTISTSITNLFIPPVKLVNEQITLMFKGIDEIDTEYFRGRARHINTTIFDLSEEAKKNNVEKIARLSKFCENTHGL